jgi:hypothetical protein
VTLTVVDSDYQDTSAPSVSYQADDWVILVWHIAGNFPLALVKEVELTSSGGGFMTVYNGAEMSGNRFAAAHMRVTNSGTSTFAVTLDAGSALSQHGRHAFVVRGVPVLEGLTLLAQDTDQQSPTISGSTFTDTLTTFSGGAVAILAGQAGVAGASAGLALDSLTPSDDSGTAYLSVAGAPGSSFSFWAGIDLSGASSWTAQHSVSSPPYTPYATSRHAWAIVYGTYTVPNDDVADASVITGCSGQTSRQQIDIATTEVSEPVGSDLSNGIFETAWFKWTAPVTHHAVFDTHLSYANNYHSGDGARPSTPVYGFLDTTLAVYTGNDFTDFVEVASSDDQPFIAGEYWSRVEFDAVMSTDYWIQIGTYDEKYVGTYVLSWSACAAGGGGGGGYGYWALGAPEA